MVDSLILVLFLVSGAAAGWLGVDLLPESLLVQVDNPEGLRTVDRKSTRLNSSH